MPKIRIDKSNHRRAILTDTLPYEVPLYFTNEYIFQSLSNEQLLSALPTHISKFLASRNKETRPFSYRVRKTGGGYRKLAIPHIAAQIGFSEFYRDFDSFIENVCSRSTFSLRYPSRVGSHFYQSQYASATEPYEEIDPDPSSFAPQRKWASSYFSYKRFNHIHKFFGSQEFFRLEQKYSLMLKMDVARCFESIYTHSITWAIRGKDFGKQNKRRNFFESVFDKKMQDANWGETSGIIIGPEVSRVFAECILQSIDVELAQHLEKSPEQVEVSRYVDDYFVFSNSEDAIRLTQESLEKIASKFNLYFNPSKTELVRRPFAAPFSVARFRVRKNIEELFGSAKSTLTDASHKSLFNSRTAERFASEVRRIATEFKVEYSALASPALAVIAKGLSQLASELPRTLPENTSRHIETICSTFVRIATFFHLMDIRSATSDKLAKVFFECSRLTDKAGGGRLALEGIVQDSLRQATSQAHLSRTTGPEVINVMVAADSICKKIKGISEQTLRAALSVDGDWKSACKNFNYFELTSILYFSKKKYSFLEAKEAACAEIEQRVLARGRDLADFSEETMLFFDFLSCPYIDEGRRASLYGRASRELGATLKPDTVTAQFKAVSKSIRFISWSGGRQLGRLLERRELQPAYES